ncbi:MAG: hypothetical protein DME23_17085 [Verrucomicrobia bacterium]|nr:MAG: hypothetical protein DME23_17085 [Verrucomicrobiota bacterium]
MLGFLGGLEVVLLCLFGGLIGLGCFVLWIWMLIDCLTNNGIPGSEKVAWVLVIIFTHFLGALIYFFVGRPKRKPA